MSTPDSSDFDAAADVDNELHDNRSMAPQDPDISDTWSPVVYRLARCAEGALLLVFILAVVLGIAGRGPLATLADAANWVQSTWPQELGSAGPDQSHARVYQFIVEEVAP